MLPVSGKVNVFVSAPGSEAVRRASFIRLIGIYPIDSAREETFVGGERVLLRGEVSDNEGQRMATSLRALGLRVDIEPCTASADMMSLEGFTTDEPFTSTSKAADTFNPLFDVGAGLVGLDGGDEDHAARDGAPAAAPLEGGLLGGMFGTSLRDEDEPLAGGDRPRPAAPKEAPPPRHAAPPPAPRAAPPRVPGPPPRAPAPPPRAPAPPPRAPAPPPVAAAAPSYQPPNHGLPSEEKIELDTSSRFRPKGVRDSGEMLAVDRPAPDPMVSMRPAEDVIEVPRCPTHGLAKHGGRCARCDEEEAKIRGKLFGGKLREKPPVRIGIGIVAGLLLGWILTAPMARRAERQIEYIREEARREHARPLEEAQAHAAQLDQQAEEDQQGAFFKTLAVWGVIAAAVTGVWLKLT